MAVVAAVAAWVACAPPALGEPGGRRTVLEGPSGPIDLSRQPRASGERPGASVRFVRPRAVIVTDGPMTESRGAALAAMGVTGIRPVGRDAHTAVVPSEAAARVEALGFVRSVSWFRAEWKLDPGLDRREFADADRRALRDLGMARVHVHLFADAGAPEAIAVRDAVSALPGAVVHGTSRIGSSTLISADVSRADLGAIASLGAVQFVEPAPEITFRNNTARGVVQSNVPGNVPLHNAGLTGSGAIVAVCDSGLDTAHCAFTGKLVAFNGASNVTDHGTHVSCIAAGNGPGGGDLRGHAYGAGLVFSRTPAFTFDQLSDTLELQASQGAFVHTNSWGDDTTTLYTGMSRAIDDFMHAHEDHLVVFAATNLSALRTPENSKNALSVAAVNDAPNQDVICFGGGGLTADGRLKPDVLAPGCNIISADGLTACSTRVLSGTSMATPAVAGTAVLVRQYFEQGFYPAGVATPGAGFAPTGALVKATMINSATGATGVPDLPGSASAFRAWGRVLADDALYFAGDTRRTVVRDVRNGDGVATGSVVDIPVEVTGSGARLKVTLVWTDPAPAPGVQTALVNDLDLTVIGPDATEYLGNVFTGGISAVGGVADTVNTVEQVHIDGPDVGVWTVRITGSSIPDGPQGFALVVTGEVDPGAVGLTIANATPAPPTTIAPGAAVAPFVVRVDEGSDALVGGSPMLHYRYAGPAFTSVPLADLGGNEFAAVLPRASCGHTPMFFVTAEGVATGVVASPVAGATGARSALVGEAWTDEVFAEDFESGIPVDWTVAGTPAEWEVGVPGPWLAASSCSGVGGCTGDVWAYCGNPGVCDYSNGFFVQGGLTTPVVDLPPLGPGERLTLVYCTAMTNENVSRFDRGMVRINGVELDEAPHSAGAWMVREVDLSGFAGQSVQIEFYFNTVDSFSNGFVGWLIDSMSIAHTGFDCQDPCPGDVNGNGQVDALDFNILATNYGAGPNATRDEGDLTGDGVVNAMDFNILAGAFGSECD